MSFILLCLAVIVLSIPAPAPWARWVAFALALTALIIFLVGYRTARFSAIDQKTEPQRAHLVIKM